MDCKEIRNLIYHELDAMITTEQKIAIEKHIKTCSICACERNEFFTYKKKIAACFAEIDIPKLSPDFDRNFYYRLSQQKSLIEKIRETFIFQPFMPRRVWAPAMAILIVVLLLVLLPKNEKNSLITTAENNSTLLMKCAVIQSQNMQIENKVDIQAKEILQNFL